MCFTGRNLPCCIPHSLFLPPTLTAMPAAGQRSRASTPTCALQAGIATTPLLPHTTPTPAGKTCKAPPLSAGKQQRRSSSTSYLYLKRNIYYFRFVFPGKWQHLLGHAEIRMSLRTSYRAKARQWATHLAGTLLQLLYGEGMLDYKEIRRRLNIGLQKM